MNNHYNFICLFYYFFLSFIFEGKRAGMEKTFVKYLLTETHVVPHFSFSKTK